MLKVRQARGHALPCVFLCNCQADFFRAGFIGVNRINFLRRVTATRADKEGKDPYEF